MKNVIVINDWQLDDLYKSMIEGALLSIDPSLNVIFFRKSINSFDTMTAAFLLKLALNIYPEKSIFLIAVNSVVDENNGYLLLKVKGRYIIAPNNGVLSMINNEEIEWVKAIPYVISTFPELDIFSSIIQILKNNEINILNNVELSNIKRLKYFIPFVEENKIISSVIYIDSYGNVITNVSKSFFEKATKGKRFLIYPNTTSEKITEIVDSYIEVQKNEFFALFNSMDLLEIGIFGGNISNMYKIELRTNLMIELI